jgi:membrane protein
MLKNKTKIIAFLLVLILAITSSFVYADNETSSENDIALISDTSETKPVETNVENTVSTNETSKDSYKNSDVYLMGDNVTIDYVVDGNLFVMADTVTINSKIGGDAFIMAKTINVGDQAYIFSNLFAMANSIDIKGVVYDVYALSQNFTVSNGYIYRDAKLCCNTININGVIGRNAFVSCSNINFNTDENDKGIIYGDLTYSTPSELSFDKNIVNGNVTYKAPKVSPEKSVREIVASYISDLGAFLAFVIIIWLVCLWLAPKFLNDTNKFVGKKTLNVLGTGLLTLIALPIACIILLLLQLTAGISLLTVAIYILALIVAKSIFTIVANNYLCSKLNINKNTGIFGMLIVSGVIVWVISELPYVGGIVSFIISVLGLGVLVSAILPKKAKKASDTDKVKETTKTDVKKEISENNDTKKENKKENK